MLKRRFVVLTLFLVANWACANTLADWVDTTTDIASDAPNTVRTMALSQSAVYEAVNAITRRYPRDVVDFGAAKGASIDAAIAAANMTVLRHEAAAHSKRIEEAYDRALKALPDDAARARGVDIGVRAANDVLSKHTDDLGNPQPYRPVTEPGVYVVTTFPLGVAVSQHKPWFLTSPAQFRPGPPPALLSEVWVRDYNETMIYGAAESTVRTPEQTLIARFWATALPDVHIGVVRALATDPKREITRNARLYAAVTAAMSDTEIAVFEAKYFYNFWRPFTAIRNGDRDGNPSTDRTASWAPLIVTPVQPEYPCAHCMIASTIATVIRMDVGKEPLPLLSSVSNTLPGQRRTWKTTEEVVAEVVNARIWDGVHYRNSGEVGVRMGEQVGTVVAKAFGMN
jgi:PAP2 superfamily